MYTFCSVSHCFSHTDIVHWQVAIGTKAGDILLYDIATSSLMGTVTAHTATVWSLHVRTDEQALVSGSADHDVKFWDFEKVNKRSTT